jgi:cyanophycinase
LAIQGQYVYTAEYGSVSSSEALAFPFIPLITLTNAFLKFPFMQRIVTDTHFYQRDRMGRLVTFMARIVQNHWTSSVLGIGVSEETGLSVPRQPPPLVPLTTLLTVVQQL